MSALDTLPAIETRALDDAAALQQAADAGEPAIFRGLVRDWPLVAAASQSDAALCDALRQADRGAPVPVMETPPSSGGRFGYAPGLHDFSFTKRHRPLAETLDRLLRAAERPEGPTVAIQMLPLTESLPAIAAANPMPLLPGAAPLLWLGGPVQTQIHNDRDHNLACVVAGRRRFVLFPPEQVANLYIGPPDNPPPLSLVDPEAPDPAIYPRFAEALKAAQVAELEPGDALLIPRHWWHHVTSRAPFNAMVNYWWGRRMPGAGNPHDAFLAALLAIKALPAAERHYWQAMFAAYVFAEDDAAVAHLPPSLRGFFGDMPPSARERLAAALRQAFNSR
jgi:hypothetical protein